MDKGRAPYPHWPPTSHEEAEGLFDNCFSETNLYRKYLPYCWWLTTLLKLKKTITTKIWQDKLHKLISNTLTTVSGPRLEMNRVESLTTQPVLINLTPRLTDTRYSGLRRPSAPQLYCTNYNYYNKEGGYSAAKLLWIRYGGERMGDCRTADNRMT